MNAKKSICINYQYENGKLTTDTSVFKNFHWHNEKTGFQYLRYHLTYNLAATTNCDIIHKQVQEGLNKLQGRQVHASSAINIISATAHGAIRYFAQLRRVTNSGLDKINKSVCNKVRCGIRVKLDTSKAVLQLDRQAGGGGLVTAEETVAIACISTIMHTLNCNFGLAQKSTWHELKYAANQRVKPTSKAKNPYATFIAALKKFNLSIAWKEARLNIKSIPYAPQWSEKVYTPHMYTDPVLTIYVDASFHASNKLAGGAVSYRNSNNRLLRFNMFQIPPCKSSITAEIVAIINILYSVCNGASVKVFVDNRTALHMNEGVRYKLLYVQYFWWLARKKHLQITLQWIRGHFTDFHNVIIDTLAKWAAKHGTISDINSDIISNLSNKAFLVHNNSLVPNLRKVVHNILQIDIKNKFNDIDRIKSNVVVDSKNYSHHSFNFWNTSYSQPISNTIIRVRWDFFYNKTFKNLISKCNCCGVDATMFYQLLICLGIRDMLEVL
jgi:ribonuclease HI